jgi:dTDP-glucose pyrophosphorylase
MTNILNMINIVIPMAGLGSRFKDAGYIKPKPFIDVNGVSMIERVLKNLYIPNSRFILIGRQEHIDEESITVEKIKFKYKNTIFIGINKLTEGTVCTILYAKSYIDNDSPLLIANSDQIVDINIQDFISDSKQKKVDGSILSFYDNDLNPKWSFIKINKNNNVIEVKEKEAISNIATVGIYFFNNGKDFINASIQMIIENERVNNEFYTCPVYNYLIKNKLMIGYYIIDHSMMHGIGTPDDLNKYLKIIEN